MKLTLKEKNKYIKELKAELSKRGFCVNLLGGNEGDWLEVCCYSNFKPKPQEKKDETKQ